MLTQWSGTTLYLAIQEKIKLNQEANWASSQLAKNEERKDASETSGTGFVHSVFIFWNGGWGIKLKTKERALNGYAAAVSLPLRNRNRTHARTRTYRGWINTELLLTAMCTSACWSEDTECPPKHTKDNWKLLNGFNMNPVTWLKKVLGEEGTHFFFSFPPFWKVFFPPVCVSWLIPESSSHSSPPPPKPRSLNGKTKQREGNSIMSKRRLKSTVSCSIISTHTKE